MWNNCVKIKVKDNYEDKELLVVGYLKYVGSPKSIDGDAGYARVYLGDTNTWAYTIEYQNLPS
jgi:hypothetical protein